jgi:hypothetical protein
VRVVRPEPPSVIKVTYPLAKGEASVFIKSRKPTSQSRQSAKLSLQSSELGLPHPPYPQASVPPPFGLGGGHTRLRKRGWGSPNSDEGTYTVYISTLWPTLKRQNTEISKQIFPEKEYGALSPSFHIHASVSDLYIPTIGMPILLEEICRPILGLYKSLTDT